LISVYKYKIAKGKRNPAKATAWKWFSLYIRLRDCLSTTGSAEWCICPTCGQRVAYEDIDAGHALGHRQGSVLFDESITYGQCRACNQAGDGEKQAFKAFLIRKYGAAWYEMKDDGKSQTVSYTEFEYRAIADKYRKAYKALLK
jgi:hypothetical protein